MGAYEYTALDKRGKNVRGVLHGDTPKQIRQLLRDQNLIPLKVDETGSTLTKAKSLGSFRRLNTSDMILFTRQLATMIQAGETLDSSLNSIANEFTRPFTRKIIYSIRSALLEGQNLAGALQQYKRQFPDFYIATISAGEHSGKLGLILEHLADYIENRQQHNQQILVTLLYPVIVIAVALLIVIALMTHVVPQVIHVYQDMDQQLPMLTQMLVATSDFLRENMTTILLTLLISLVSFLYMYRVHEIRRGIQHMLLSMPFVGTILTKLQVARFCKTLSILLMSGVEIIEALKIASNVITFIPMKERIELAAQNVREGASVYKSLGGTGDFPPMTLQLISSGENSGKLGEMLDRSANSLDHQLQVTFSVLLGLFEPLLILFLGMVILVIVLAILLPIFDLNQMITM